MTPLRTPAPPALTPSDAAKMREIVESFRADMGLFAEARKRRGRKAKKSNKRDAR